MSEVGGSGRGEVHYDSMHCIRYQRPLLLPGDLPHRKGFLEKRQSFKRCEIGTVLVGPQRTAGTIYLGPLIILSFFRGFLDLNA